MELQKFAHMQITNIDYFSLCFCFFFYEITVLMKSNVLVAMPIFNLQKRQPLKWFSAVKNRCIYIVQYVYLASRAYIILFHYLLLVHSKQSENATQYPKTTNESPF